MTYAEQLAIIKDIPIREGDSKVIQCPFCYGVKKFTISKHDGKTLWNCYRASCNGKGIYSGKRDVKAVKNYLAKTILEGKSNFRPVPSITTSVYNAPRAIDFLNSVNSLEAFKNGYIEVRYSPAEDRVVFYTKTGAVGRTLSGIGPKWVSYGLLPNGIHVGEGSTAVLVEDVPSACSISRMSGYVGVALLGTTITSSIKLTLSTYTKIYLVLDKDASLKSITQHKKITQQIHIRFTQKDLKYLSTEKIQKLLSVT